MTISEPDPPPDLPATLPELRAVAARCTACDLYARATQTVFGEGPARARAVLIGEQPGDQEDRTGRPFVGPAGRILDDACHDAGIDRASVYLTNAVKHFKWRPAGKRRLHQKPNAREVRACQMWWKAELELVQPDVVVCLGATAAQAVLGKAFRLTAHRGEWQRLDDRRLLATVHPSAVLRAGEARDEVYSGLVDDLTLVAEVLGSS
jgi:uracil-DNA glycosylase family protein